MCNREMKNNKFMFYVASAPLRYGELLIGVTTQKQTTQKQKAPCYLYVLIKMFIILTEICYLHVFYCIFNAIYFIIDFTSLLKCLPLFCRNIYTSIRKRLVHRLKINKTAAFPMAIIKRKKRQLQPHFLMVGEESRVLQVFILSPAYQTGDVTHAPGLDFYLCTHNFH